MNIPTTTFKIALGFKSRKSACEAAWSLAESGIAVRVTGSTLFIQEEDMTRALGLDGDGKIVEPEFAARVIDTTA